MSTTNSVPHHHQKTFARLLINWTTPNGETVTKTQILESAQPPGDRLDVLNLATPEGQMMAFSMREFELPQNSDDRGAFAFAALADTLQPVLDLGGTMDDATRARIGRQIWAELSAKTGPHTIREMRVGDLINAIKTAKAVCVVV